MNKVKRLLIVAFPFIPFREYKQRLNIIKSRVRFVVLLPRHLRSYFLKKDRYFLLTEEEAHFISLVFDLEEYNAQSGMSFREPWLATKHYLSWGETQGISPSLYFNPSYYQSQLKSKNIEVSADESLLLHFFHNGIRNNLNPIPDFDTRYYLEVNGDVYQAGTNPLYHYIAYGDSEGRNPNSQLPVSAYRKTLFQTEDHSGNVLKDFLQRKTDQFIAGQKAQVILNLETELRAFLIGESRLKFENVDDSMITVIIPVWNKAYFTLKVLDCLSRAEISLKIIVINNGSTDETEELLGKVSGITIIHNSENLGFVRATNQGIFETDTPFMLFLNNDTDFDPNVLRFALENMSDKTVGGVVSKVVLPNGLLQEAGSFLDKNLSPQGYLRNQFPDCDLANISREVDFGSGLFLFCRSDIVKSLDGLDRDFEPAYGEEVDLCIRMMKSGFRILYDPRIRIKHFEFGSSVSEAAAISLQIEHQKTLQEKHSDFFKDRPIFESTNATSLAFFRQRHFNYLIIIDDRLPLETAGAGAPRMRGIIKTIMESNFSNFQTEFFCTAQEKDYEKYSAIRIQFPKVIFHMDTPLEQRLREASTLRHVKMKIWVSRPHNLQKLLALLDNVGMERKNFEIIYDSEAINSLRIAPVPGISQWSKISKKLSLQSEMKLAEKADKIVAVQPYELELFSSHTTKPSFLLGFREEVFMTSESHVPRNKILFLGRLNDIDSPNATGLIWFVNKCLEETRISLNTSLIVAGEISEKVANQIYRPGVTILGPIENLSDAFSGVRVFVAPTFIAAGLPQKIYTATTRGVPVILTRILAAQLGWENERECLIADSQHEFIQGISKLFKDADLCKRIVISAQDSLRDQCSPNLYRDTLNKILL
jgi:GT2 family glycosyltransferase